MLEELEKLLKARGIPFSCMGNRIRCFPHVVNISVHHGLSALTLTEKPSDSGTTSPATCDIDDALQDDTVKCARQLVAACRASGQRREEFSTAIREGNESGAFGENKKLRVVQLLRDVDTRWSSTFLMIDRLLELYPAVVKFMEQPKQEEIHHLLLSDAQLKVLLDIREFLHLPHLVQELLSAEQTPTVCQALPAYERLLNMLEVSTTSFPKIAHAIEASASALRKYMSYTRQSRVYALAMSKSYLYITQ
ncbi:hypothetical protein BC628DRAFT_1328464 [Trametes gibbosa]|nr:hypothetical protein BC628DRAFT_1328464 [Trametes gibbosa]